MHYEFSLVSVRLSIGITSGPIFDPAPIGLVLWVVGRGCLSRQHPAAAAPAHHAGAWSAARYRPGRDYRPMARGRLRGQFARARLQRTHHAEEAPRKIAMTPMMTSVCSCDGDMSKPQKHAPARHYVRTTTGNPRSAAGSGRTMSPGRAQVKSSVRGVASRGRLAWLRAGHADQCPVTSPVLTCQG